MSPTIRSGRALATRLYFWLAKAARGAGRPTTKEAFDEQYRGGRWKHLDTVSEMAPCMIAAGYVNHLFRAPRVLDMGCGHGRLGKLLSRFPLQSYVGVDLSTEAIAQARAAGIENASFIVGDFEVALPAQRFDVVVFLDSLYYARDPLAVLRRYSEALDPEGLFIVSMYRYSNNPLILRTLARHFEAVDKTIVRNRGRRWDIHVLRPRG